MNALSQSKRSGIPRFRRAFRKQSPRLGSFSSQSIEQAVKSKFSMLPKPLLECSPWNLFQRTIRLHIRLLKDFSSESLLLFIRFELAAHKRCNNGKPKLRPGNSFVLIHVLLHRVVQSMVKNLQLWRFRVVWN